MNIDKTVLASLTNVVGSEARAIEIISAQIRHLVSQGLAHLLVVHECERMADAQQGDRHTRLERWSDYHSAYTKSVLMLAEVVGDRIEAKGLINQRMN